jgi:hypothetical protein
MLSKSLLFVLICLLASCRDEVTGFNSSENLIPRDTMVMLIKDMTLLESHVQMKYIQVNRYHKTMKKSGDLILKKYQISSERYEASINYYGSHQEEMQSIYSQVLDSLNRMSNQIDTKDTAEPIDSNGRKLPFGILQKEIKK